MNSFSQNRFFLSLSFSIHTDLFLIFQIIIYGNTLFDFWTVGVLLGLEGWSGAIQDEEKEDLGFIPQPTKKSVHKLPKKGDCDVLHCFFYIASFGKKIEKDRMMGNKRLKRTEFPLKKTIYCEGCDALCVPFKKTRNFSFKSEYESFSC